MNEFLERHIVVCPMERPTFVVRCPLCGFETEVDDHLSEHILEKHELEARDGTVDLSSLSEDVRENIKETLADWDLDASLCEESTQEYDDWCQGMAEKECKK